MRVFSVIAFLTASFVGVSGTSHAENKPAFAPVIDRAIEEVIQPSYAALVSNAGSQAEALDALCATPSATNLDISRAAFGDLVIAWSAVEMFRFGPARAENRFEKLFFWPDRNGRGLKQVQGILARKDDSATSFESLQNKSVAVQGLIALDFVLFGTGSEGLEKGEAFRCKYALAISHVIENTSQALVNGWTGSGSYSDVITTAGPDNAVYKSHGEVVQDLLRAASEQLQIVRDLKLTATIGKEAGKAKPKRAPFWRSSLTIPSMSANIDAVEALLAAGISELLAGEDERLATSVGFELSQAKKALSDAEGFAEDWLSIVEAEEGRGKLVAATFPLQGAIRLVGERYPAALGLVLGFNSLDGD